MSASRGASTSPSRRPWHPAKTGANRQVPIHPTLQAILDHWRRTGAQALLGREVVDTDPIVPSPRTGGERDKYAVSRRRREDLARLGLRPRRLHDARRTFVTLCRAGGARGDVIRSLTHTTRTEMIDVYSTLPWETLCEAITCLQVEWAPQTPATP